MSGLVRNARALVGWTGSNGDRVRLAAADEWLAARSSAKRWTDVKFNLIYEGGLSELYGKDFLVDDRRFDVVVLCFIFAGEAEGDERSDYGGDEALQRYFELSPHHSPERWRERLRASGARLVLACGRGTEIAEEYLGDLGGYRRERTGFGVAYTRADVGRVGVRRGIVSGVATRRQYASG